MCTYNGEAYLAEQLESIFMQSRPADEIIVCDDVSTDNTWKLLEKYRCQYPGLIKSFRNESNLGPAKNFEKAIHLCTGDLISLSDQDDIWRRDKLEIMARRFKEKPDLGLVFSNAGLIDAEGERLDTDLWRVVGFDRQARAAIRNEDALRRLLRKPFATGCTMMFHAKLREMCLPISRFLMHDYWLSLVAAAYCRIEYVDEQLVCYRQHTANEVGAPKLSVKQRIDRACRMGILQCEHDLMGLEALIEHLDRSGKVDQDSLTLIQQKTDFLRSRLELWSDDSPWFRRTSVLARNVLWARYGRWSNGLATLTKDLALLLGIVRRPGSSTTRIPGSGV
jgi:hypothetical protein